MQNRTTFFAEIERNKWKSVILIAVVFLVILGLTGFMAYYLAPEYAILAVAMVPFIVVAQVMTYWFYGDRIFLAATGAQPADRRKYPHLYNVIEGLSLAAGTPRPSIYVIQSDEMNAFATGVSPERASVAFTTGLLENLNRQELEGVAAHEMSHIGNYDIRFALVVSIMVGIVAILSDMMVRSWRYGGMRMRSDRKGGGGAVLVVMLVGFLLAIFAPIFTRLVQAAISRKREFLADASGAKLTRYPAGLASALRKISGNNRGDMKVSEAVSHAFFVDPTVTALDSVMATHPPIAERIKVLERM